MKIQFKRNSGNGSSLVMTGHSAGEPVWFKDKLYIGSVGSTAGGTTGKSAGDLVQVAMMSDIAGLSAVAAQNVTLNPTTPQTFVTVGGTDYTITWPSTDPWAADYAPASHTHAWSDITSGVPTTIAGYGITDAYINGNTITLGSASVTALTSHQSIKSLISSNTAQTAPTTATAITGSGNITLHKVAWTGTYSDLIGTPTIPTVNDATLTVAGDGTYLSVGTNNAGDTFTANASAAKTITVNHKTRTETPTTSTGTVGSGNTGTTGTFDVVTYTFDAAGHETAKDTKTITVTFPSAADLGVTGAMHFVGLSTSDPKGSSGATVSGHTTWDKGDVVLYGNKEYVLNGTTNVAANWVELGDESSYALKTVKVEGSGVLGGGGDLSTNRTITHNTSGVTAGSYGDSGSTRTATYGGTIDIPYITVNDTGHITSASTKTITLPASDNTIGKQVVAASNSGTSNASTTSNTTTYLNHVESGSVQSAIQIKGDGIVGVTAANGVITISASDTNQDTKVTQRVLTNEDDGVYPILASRFNVSDWASQTTLTDESKLNKEITIDNSGYVTAVGFKTHSGTGLLKSDGTVDSNIYLTTEHNQTIKAKNGTAATATTFGADDAVELVKGTAITLATDTTNKTITINHAAGASAGASKSSIGGVSNNTLTIPVVSTDAQGHVSSLTTATWTYTAPAAANDGKLSIKKDTGTAVEVFSADTANNETVNVIGGTNISLTQDTTTANTYKLTIDHATPSGASAKSSQGGVSGNTLTIPTISTDAQGHVTGLTTSTYTATPNTDEKVGLEASAASSGSYKLLLEPTSAPGKANWVENLSFHISNNDLTLGDAGNHVVTSNNYSSYINIPAAANNGNFNVVGATSSSSATTKTVKYGSADQSSATTLTFSTTATGGWFTVGGSDGAATVTLDAIDGGTF